MKKNFCLYFVAPLTCFEQQFLVRATSEESAKARLLKDVKGADINSIVEITFDHHCVYAEAD